MRLGKSRWAPAVGELLTLGMLRAFAPIYVPLVIAFALGILVGKLL